MGEVARFQGDVIVIGALYCQTLPIPANSIADAAVQAGAGIQSTKVQQERSPVLPLSDHATSVTAVRKGIARALGAGTIVGFKVWASVPAAAAGNAVITLRKNGAVILTGSLTLDDTVAANTAVVGTLSSTTLALNDQLDVEVLSVAGTAPKGVCAQVQLRETSP